MIIVDHRMPGLTGLQLLQKLKDLKLECAALMLTAYPELLAPVDADKHKQFFQIVPKPWKPEDLLAQVDLALKAFEYLACATEADAPILGERQGLRERRPRGSGVADAAMSQILRVDRGAGNDCVCRLGRRPRQRFLGS